ncbi:MAG: phosphopentomutase, partial [Selenomonas sp.]|nr:phosphopentomutase [Selenomonas sp.]
FQIAANEADVPVDELYGYCKTAREILQGEHGVGRVIARPYVGKFPDYQRTSRRHDFSLDPTGDTMMDALRRKGLDTIGVGKISDIFAGRNVSRSLGINKDNVDGMEKTLKVMDEDFEGLCFVNLVDFDMQYGHRRDIDGYAQAATVFDKQLGEFMAKMRDDDVLMITADHGCDPGAPGTDHTREYIPLLIYGKHVKEGVNLGTYPTFAMIGATISDMFDCDLKTKGESLLPRFIKD